MCTVTLESLASRIRPAHGSHLLRPLHLSTTQLWQRAFAYVHFDKPLSGSFLEHLLDTFLRDQNTWKVIFKLKKVTGVCPF